MTSGEVRRRVRLRDVAERAGVSVTTASFVLGGRDVDMRISEATRHRVLRAAQELDYRPNLTARSLRTQKSRTIGLVARHHRHRPVRRRDDPRQPDGRPAAQPSPARRPRPKGSGRSRAH